MNSDSNTKDAENPIDAPRPSRPARADGRNPDTGGDRPPAGAGTPASPPPSDAEFRRDYRLPADDDGLLAECRVTMFKAPGPGGQHKNTTMSAVRLVHEPSGLVVIGRRERSQRRNLLDALARLRGKLVARLTPPKKRRKTKPTYSSRQKRLESKKRRSGIKRLRTSRPTDD